MIDTHVTYARYGATRTLCEFVTGLAYAMEVSGGLNDGLSDRVDEIVAPVRSARDWLWHIGQLMAQKKPLPSDLDGGLHSAEARALAALPMLKILVGEACDTLAVAKPWAMAAEPEREVA